MTWCLAGHASSTWWTDVAGGITGRQWIREGSFTISGKTWDIVSLRAQFMVRQKDSQHPNWMYIRITNLSDDSMNHT
jgi:hypothetical protein